MTRIRRASGLGLASAAILIGTLAAGCSSEKEEHRRKLLQPPDRNKARAELVEKRRIKDIEGELLESEEVVAGLTLPRGLSQHKHLGNQWYYRALHRDVTIERLEEYFAPRLVTTEIRRDKTGGVWFIDSQLRHAPKDPLVTVRMAHIHPDSSQVEIYIRQRTRSKPLLTAQEAKEKMEQMRKYRR